MHQSQYKDPKHVDMQLTDDDCDFINILPGCAPTTHVPMMAVLRHRYSLYATLYLLHYKYATIQIRDQVN